MLLFTDPTSCSTPFLQLQVSLIPLNGELSIHAPDVHVTLDDPQALNSRYEPTSHGVVFILRVRSRYADGFNASSGARHLGADWFIHRCDELLQHCSSLYEGSREWSLGVGCSCEGVDAALGKHGLHFTPDISPMFS